MAKDDYNYLVFKILTYLYAVFKRKQSFDKTIFRKAITTADIPEEYLTDILRMMQNNDLIEGLEFCVAWGNEYILMNEFSDMHITSAGVQHLTENDTMKRIKDSILSHTGIITELVKMVF